jgi:hypothetical protein
MPVNRDGVQPTPTDRHSNNLSAEINSEVVDMRELVDEDGV